MKNPASGKEIARKVLKIEAEALNHIASVIDDNFEKIVDLIFHSRGRLIVTGIGKSANIAMKTVATLNSTGTPAIFMHAADATHGDLGIIGREDIVLIISKSGNTPEIKLLTSLIKSLGYPVIGMTANKESYLAQHADFLLHTPIEKEADPYDLVPTTSTTVQMAVGDALAICILHKRQFTPTDFAKFHPGGSLGKQLLLKVKNLLDKTSNPPAVSEDAPVAEVIHEITAKRVGATAVIENGKVTGIITDGDIRRMLQNRPQIDRIKARDIMSKNPKKIKDENLATEALKKMKQNNINQLIVEDQTNRYLGIIHLHDLLKEGII